MNGMLWHYSWRQSSYIDLLSTLFPVEMDIPKLTRFNGSSEQCMMIILQNWDLLLLLIRMQLQYSNLSRCRGVTKKKCRLCTHLVPVRLGDYNQRASMYLVYIKLRAISGITSWLNVINTDVCSTTYAAVNCVIINSGNGMWHVRRQAIAIPNADWMPVGICQQMKLNLKMIIFFHEKTHHNTSCEMSAILFRSYYVNGKQ